MGKEAQLGITGRKRRGERQSERERKKERMRTAYLEEQKQKREHRKIDKRLGRKMKEARLQMKDKQALDRT